MDKVAILRSELEVAGWRLPEHRIKQLTATHLELISQLDTSPGPVFYNGKPLLSSFTRVCTGAHGPYIEFRKEHLLTELKLKVGQEWRASEKYKYVKYIWLTPAGEPELKIYLQKHRVNYADYRPGYYYVDFYSVSRSMT